MTLPKLTSIVLLCALCGSALAQGTEGGMPPPPGPAMGPAMGPGHGEGRHPGPPLLRGVVLDEAQDDKVFAILHALAPQRREQERSLHQSRDALRALARSGQFDENKAAALAKSAGAAVSALALLDARADARILAVMTPEQRRQAEEGRPRHQPRFEK